jgi:DNA-binding beta-propeller fold protein YncE
VTRNRGRSALLPAIALLLLVESCSSNAKKPTLGAAEPAVAPTSSVAPDGLVVKVGGSPEGLVFDPVSGLVAVAVRDPDRLILLDGTTMRIVKSVPLAGHARHLQLAKPGGPVLVPEEDANTLALVSLPDGVLTELKTGTSPHDAAAVNGGYVAGDEFGRSITIARTGQAEQTVNDLQQPGGIVGFGDQVVVVDVGDFTVSSFQVSDGKRIGRVAAGKGPTHGVRTADGQLLVSDTRGDALLRYSEAPLALKGTTPLPGTPYGMATDSSAPRIWVTLTARNQIVGFDVSTGGLTEIARLATVDQPDTVAVEPGSHVLYITGSRTGVVQRLTR